MNLAPLVGLLAGALLASCASDRPARELSSDHPASVHARIPERAPFVDPLDVAPPSAAPIASSASTVVAALEYVCPMHPEVVRSRPGECPECGMALQPRERHSHEEQR